MLRTHTCGELKLKNKGARVVLCGWVAGRRDHGGVIFIDLRDRYGRTQVVFRPEKKEIFETASALRAEFVLRVEGKVLLRPKEMANKKIKTGEIEMEAEKLEILSKAKTPPFEIGNSAKVNEEVRLKYRFLDLRDERLQGIIKLRDELIAYVRKYFHERGFTEVQTPILANSSPEGARDYLVPSRLYPGKFYALPQAPQQFKQLLMVGGLDKYFQIAPCFRDEDPRADRHPGDFYQIDMEMSFVEQEDVWQEIEPLMTELTEKFSDKKIVKKPFPRLTYWEAMDKYGSDKPDLRFGFEIKDISKIAASCPASQDLAKRDKFQVFEKAIKSGGVVRALKIDGGAKFSRKEIDELTEIAKKEGAKGLAYIIYDNEPKSPILKFFSSEEIAAITKAVLAKKGDIVFFGADQLRVVCKALGAVRDACGKKLGLKDPKKAAWLWIYDFPMYEYSAIEKKIDFSHNPFSMPQGGLKALKAKNPLDIVAYQYDIVCNGYEISSGAIRNSEPETMYKAFEIAGYSREEVDKKFGHMIRAFEYGAPPHGGCAPGLDRLLMILLNCESIRDIYAFPKNGHGQDAMLGSPSDVSERQLKELKVKITK